MKNEIIQSAPRQLPNLIQRIQFIQSDVTAVAKDSTNPHFRSKYADINSFIEMLKPLLTKHNVVVLQPLKVVESGGTILQTIITCETGEREVSEIFIPANADPQKLGAWITYMRRYSLQSMFMLGADDLDAEDAVRPTAPKAPTSTATRTWNATKPTGGK